MTEEDNIIVFDASKANPVMKMPKLTLEKYEGDERTYIDEVEDEIFSSYRLLLIAYNASCFDSWVELNSLVKRITDLKVIKTARGLISLSFHLCGKLVKIVQVPQNVKFTCSKSHITSSLEKTGREYGLQTEIFKEEIEHSTNNKSNSADLRHLGAYFKVDVLCLAFIYARHSMEMQKMSVLVSKII